VFSKHVFWCGVLALAATGWQPLALARGLRAHSLVAHVRFLATSTSVRSGQYDSEDVYLAEVDSLKRDNAPIIARLVDDYPTYRGPISLKILEAPRGAKLRLLRDLTCDIRYQDMVLRTAPGDSIAILPVKLEFRPHLPEAIQPEQLLPCYRIVRR
jgi:hypothetical protein